MAKTINTLAVLAGALALLVAPAWAQIGLFPGYDNQGAAMQGFNLYQVTGFGAWQSIASPEGSIALPVGVGLRPDWLLGGGLTVGYGHSTKRSDFSVVYSADYIARLHYSNLDSLNQSIAINGMRHLTPRLTFGLSANALVSTYDQLLFSPMALTGVASAPGTFQDLSAGVLSGKYSSDQLASLLTGSPLIESPARTLFFGNRVFDSSAGLSLAYDRTDRLSFSFTLGGSRLQHLPDQNSGNGPKYNFILPIATYANAGAGLAYQVSEKTHIGFNVESGRGFSRLVNAYYSSATARIGRTLGEHWYTDLHAGAGLVSPLGHTHTLHEGPVPVAGLTLGYRGLASTLIMSYDRTVGDTFGIGATKSSNTQAAWNYRHPGSQWTLSSSFGWMQLYSGAFANLSGWRAGAGIGRGLGRHTDVRTEYFYGSYSTHYHSGPYDQTQNMVRLSVVWSPQAATER